MNGHADHFVGQFVSKTQFPLGLFDHRGLGHSKLGFGFWLDRDLDLKLPLVRIKTDQTKDDLMIFQSAYIRCACCDNVHSSLLSVCDTLNNDPKR